MFDSLPFILIFIVGLMPPILIATFTVKAILSFHRGDQERGLKFIKIASFIFIGVLALITLVSLLN